MKARNIPIITGLVCASIMMEMVNTPVPIRAGLSFAIDNDLPVSRAGSIVPTLQRGNEFGYKPVLDECPDIKVGAYCRTEGRFAVANNTPVPYDNTLYKEWCESTFKHGSHIYEAYRDIAFNIKYTPESAKTDFWQTPFETTESGNGDCEDAVFLFFSHLLPDQENAEIVWGWVIDRTIGAAKAHVWYQLKDKAGQLYVVEGFSNDWDGIIPMEIIKQTESRKPIFTLSHLEASRLDGMISKPDSWEIYQLLADLHGSTDFITPEPDDKSGPERRYTRRHLNTGFIGHQGMSHTFNTTWESSVSDRMAAIMSKEISKIFKKLHVLFTRYDGQKEAYTSSLQVTSKYSHSKKNLNCRR